MPNGEDKMIDLARRAVACKAWRWLPGMLDTDGGLLVQVDECDGTLVTWFHPDHLLVDDEDLPEDGLPDLSDPATIGCLTALVREAWDDRLAQVRYANGEWWLLIYVDGERTRKVSCEVCELDGEAEALVAALEAAPG